MPESERQRIGFACAYTPLPLIHAAGFVPYRILPNGDWPDQAGQLLHDNLCPHIKRILDRAMVGDLPELTGMVFINSCDAMRRLTDAWRKVRPNDRTVLMDLPATVDEISIGFLAKEMARLGGFLSKLRGREIHPDEIEHSLSQYDKLARLMDELGNKTRRGFLPGGSARMQNLYNQAATQPVDWTISLLEKVLLEVDKKTPDPNTIPVFVFGNMLPDPEAFELFESCGVRVAGDDFCTGSRLFNACEFIDTEGNTFRRMAKRILSHPPCARTFDPAQPMRIATDVVNRAMACGAKGVIGHTIKFCDPYLARIPMVREALKTAGIPFLLLEGDCTLRSIGQQRTRIEAFIEMLR